MQQLPGSQYRVQFGLKGWAAIVAGLAIMVAALIAVAFVALGLLVIALPVILVAPVIYYFMPNRKMSVVLNPGVNEATKDANASGLGTIIDGEFRVIDSVTNENASDE